MSGISINPLSEFVNSRAIARAVGSSIATALPLAISDIEKDYGLSSDPATLAPDYTAADVSTDAGKLGLIVGALINEDENLCPGAPGALVTALSADIAKGDFNGRTQDLGNGNPISYCGGNLPPIAGGVGFLDALSGLSQLQLVTEGFGFGGVYGPAGNVLMSQSPPVTPDLLASPVASIAKGLSYAVDIFQDLIDSLLFSSQGSASGPNMNQAREGAAATLLENGKVLITGGFVTNSDGSVTFLDSSELYDPVANSFASAAGTATMTSARAGHTSTLLGNGNVLLAGSDYTTEIYNASTGAFLAGANMNFNRAFDTATLLPNGNVLIAGGSGRPASDTNLSDDTELSSTEIFVPSGNSGTFELAGSTPVMGTARQQHTATLLPTGKVLIAGGYNSSGGVQVTLNTTELYDPASSTFTAGPNMNVARFGASASLTAYGTVLIAGGNISAGPGSFKPTSSVEIYDPATNTFASTTPSMNGTTGSLAPFATLLQNGAVLLIANNPAGAKANELFEAPSEVYPGASLLIHPNCSRQTIPNRHATAQRRGLDCGWIYFSGC